DASSGDEGLRERESQREKQGLVRAAAQLLRRDEIAALRREHAQVERLAPTHVPVAPRGETRKRSTQKLLEGRTGLEANARHGLVEKANRRDVIGDFGRDRSSSSRQVASRASTRAICERASRRSFCRRSSSARNRLISPSTSRSCRFSSWIA